jgi:hypothetical protein
MRALAYVVLMLLAPLSCAATEPLNVWMTDCQPDLLTAKHPSNTRRNLCGVLRPNGQCRVSSAVLLRGSAPPASISSLALTLGTEIKSVSLIRFASDVAAYVYYPHRPAIRLYVQENGTWRLQHSCFMPVP